MHIWTDFRHTWRTGRRQPGLAALIIVTLGLGIGATTAIFSAVDGLLLAPPPFTDPERLVRISSVRGTEEGPLAVPELDALTALPVIADAAMYTDQGMYNASGFGAPEELTATITNHNLFRVLGVAPMIGSSYPADSDRTRQFHLVISHGLWVRRFGRDPNIVGRTMTLDGAPGYVIHGVLPQGFNFPSHSDLFRSSGISPDPQYYERRDVRGMMVVARLAPGVSVAHARDALTELGRRLEREFPESNGGLTFRVIPITEMYTSAIRPYVLLLVVAVSLVLLIACANVANLLLSRAIARDREVVVRMALGASRWRIVRQLLVESVVYAGAGAALGLAIAVVGVRLLTAMVPEQLPIWMQVSIDIRVVAFLIGVALLTGIIAGLAPALRSSSRDLHGALKDGSRGSSSGGYRRLRSGLVVAEVALAFVLLVGAALLVQTVVALQRVPLGFDTADTLTFRTELGWAAYGTTAKTEAFHRQVLQEMRALPGVTAVTFDNNLPISGKPRDAGPVRLFAQSPDEEARNPFVHYHIVGPDYFEVMGIRLAAGRAFTDDDRSDTQPVVIVSRRTAERLWPGQDPVGRLFQYADAADRSRWLIVVGVAEPVLHHELDGQPGLDTYIPFTQQRANGAYYVLRTSGDPMRLAPAATAIIGRVDPNQSFLDVQTYDQRVANRIWQRRLAGVLFGAFAALAALLAAVGLYGVLAQLVVQQTRDIGVRMALGAARSDIRRLVIGRGLMLATVGAVLGLAIALVAARGLGALLFAVTPWDPLTFLAVAVLLLAVATLACYLPARRAMALDPIAALRME